MKSNPMKFKSSHKRRPATEHDKPTLRFTPYAWAKLKWFCHRGGNRSNTEVGGFGITPPEDPLLIEDFVTLKQRVTSVSVEFDDEAVADFFEQQVDAGRRPGEFARIWLHTHPGASPMPSGLDEETFARCFGECDWAVMFILAEEGPVYARMRFNAGPGGEIELPVDVDYGQPFPGSDPEAWQAEYDANIDKVRPQIQHAPMADEDETAFEWPDVDDPAAESVVLEILADLERADDVGRFEWLMQVNQLEDDDDESSC